MIVELVVKMDVSFCEDTPDPVKGEPLYDRVLASVKEAVNAALDYATGDGYKHDMEDELSLFPRDVSVLRVDGE